MRIGTRKSVMALAQTEDIARRLSAAAPIHTELRGGISLAVGIPSAEIFRDADQQARRELELLALVFGGAILAVLIGAVSALATVQLPENASCARAWPG